MSAADIFNGVRLAATESIVVRHVRRHLPVGQIRQTVIHRGSNLTATGIDRLLEHFPTGDVRGHRHAVANGQIERDLITVVAVGTIRIAGERNGIALGAGKDVFAVFVLAVHQAQQLLFDLAQLGCVGLTVCIGVARVASTDRQFLGALQHVVDAGHHRFGLTQRRLDGTGVGLVLIKHRSLLTQLQQTRRANRIVSGGIDTNEAARLFAALDDVGEILLIVRSRGLVKLGGRNAHGLRLLKDC
ncbi:hypothetical protein D3C76_1023590 [compost metagenome]